MSIDVKQEVHALQEEMVSLRRDLHAHPELAFQEERTAHGYRNNHNFPQRILLTNDKEVTSKAA